MDTYSAYVTVAAKMYTDHDYRAEVTTKALAAVVEMATRNRPVTSSSPRVSRVDSCLFDPIDQTVHIVGPRDAEFVRIWMEVDLAPQS